MGIKLNIRYLRIGQIVYKNNIINANIINPKKNKFNAVSNVILMDGSLFYTPEPLGVIIFY